MDSFPEDRPWTDEELRRYSEQVERRQQRQINREYSKLQREYAPRVAEANRLLGRFARYFKVRGYTCDPERCGHSESVILSWGGFIPVCLSLEELRRAIPRMHGLSKHNARKALLG